MNKLLGFVVSAGVLVAAGVWFINNNPDFFQAVVDWAYGQLGVS